MTDYIGEDAPVEQVESVGLWLTKATIVSANIPINSSATILGFRALEGRIEGGWSVVRELDCPCGLCSVNEHGHWVGDILVMDETFFFGRRCRRCGCGLGNAGWHELGYLLRPDPVPDPTSVMRKQA